MIGNINYNKKNSYKCVKSCTSRRKAAVNAEDIDAVAALPDDWIPRHSGPILSNYLKQREQDHEMAIQDLMEDAANINKNVDAKVRALAEDLLVLIKQNQSEIDDIVQQCSDEGALKKNIRNDALNRVNKISLRRLDDTANFKREALVLERERADGLKVLLRTQFQRFIAIGNKTPKDLLHDFDNQIYDINQQLLSNSRAYSELEAQLRVQADESVVRARTSLNKLCIKVGSPPRCRSALDISEKSPFDADREREVSSLSIGKILNHVDEFDAVVSRLVQAYRNAVLKVFTGFSCKLNALEENLGKNHELLIDSYDIATGEFTDLQNIVDRTIRRLSNSMKFQSKSLLEITGADILTMQKSLWSLGDCLQVTYKILYDAGHIWDAHVLRAALAQKLTIAAVEDLLSNHDTIELAAEVPISIALEQMRNCSDADKVHQFYSNIMEMLGHTAEMYIHHSQLELNRLEEFMNLLPNLTDVLQAEFEVFLENYPRTPVAVSRNRSIQTNIDSPRVPNVNLFHLPLPRAILQTELQETSLRNWRNGFLEFFESSMSSVSEELRHQSQLWVNERATPLHMRYSVKMASHSVRAERVKAARDTRLAELLHHDSRLDSHLEAVFELVDGLPIEASQFAALDAPFLYPLVEWKNRIQAAMTDLRTEGDVDAEVKYLKMSSYSFRLAKHRHLYEQSLDAAITTFKRHIENRVQVGRISNVRFLAQIKIFHEGGRYSAHEAMRASSSLLKGSDALEACVGRALDALNRRRNQLLALADHELLPLQRVVDDVVKNNKKAQDRHKANKKK